MIPSRFLKFTMVLKFTVPRPYVSVPNMTTSLHPSSFSMMWDLMSPPEMVSCGWFVGLLVCLLVGWLVGWVDNWLVG